jgi:transcriptional regulator GlxA family with amidase domain
MAETPFVIVEAIYEGMTQLDFTAPHTALSRIPGTQTIVASRDGGEVTSDGGLTFAHTTKLADIPRCDLLFFPGGFAATEIANDAEFMAQARRLGSGAKYLTSVCTGSIVLAATGLIRGRRAACHWAWRDMLELFDVVPDPARVARDGNIITGGGVTAGLDFALTVAAELAGEAFAQGLQLSLEYAPAPPFNAGRPETAPPEVLARAKSWMDGAREQRWAEAKTAAEAVKVAG